MKEHVLDLTTISPLSIKVIIDEETTVKIDCFDVHDKIVQKLSNLDKGLTSEEAKIICEECNLPKDTSITSAMLVWQKVLNTIEEFMSAKNV